MKILENKLPPPFLTLALGAGMWGLARCLPATPIDPRLHVLLTLAAGTVALIFGAGGILAFRLAHTTINPVQIDQASRVVTGGVFRYTRNPMNVGLTALLTAWAFWLAVPWTLLGPLIFALFIHRFQILPEERVMTAKFGGEYEDYRQRVRRWL